MIRNFLKQAPIAAVILMLAGSAVAHAASLDDLELHGYLRAGARINNGDSANTCYKNPGAQIENGRVGFYTNEFRFGNECDDYGELYFTAYQLRGKDPKDPFFKTHVTLNFDTNGNTWVEAPSGGIGLFEAYIDAGNFFNTGLKYWAGKRVYRDASVHMNDDFYFANINGNGAGVYDIGMPSGTLALALFFEQGNPISNTVNNSAMVKVQTLDLRWKDIVLADRQKLDFWAAYANSASATVFSDAAGNTPVAYDSGNGYAVGLKHKYDLDNGSTNTLSAQYGAKLLEGLYLPSVITDETVKNPAAGTSLGSDKNRLRFVEDLVYQANDRVSFEFSAKYEKFSGTLATDKGTWYNVGARPLYFFNEHFGAMGEVGFSSVKFDSDDYASLLKRVTLGPVLALDSKYFSRPQLRAYYSTSFDRGNAYGLQGEVWF